MEKESSSMMNGELVKILRSCIDPSGTIFLETVSSQQMETVGMLVDS